MNSLQRNSWVLLSLTLLFGQHKCQRLSAKDMKKMMQAYHLKNTQYIDVLDGKFYPEIPYYFFVCNYTLNRLLKVSPTDQNCNGFDCWESQLTAASRLEILHTVNRYRQKVALGSCLNHCIGQKQLIIELKWNYRAELVAKAQAELCASNHAKLEERATWPDGTEVIQDTVGISFPMREGSQMEMKSYLWRFMASNKLKDWDENNPTSFRRGVMSEFGCVFIVRRNANETTFYEDGIQEADVGYLTCTYATFGKQITTEEGIASNQKCKQAAPAYDFDVSPSNVYPALCKTRVKKKRSPPIFPCPLKLDDAEVEFWCPNEDRNQETWSEKVYNIYINVSLDRTRVVHYFPSIVTPPSNFGPEIYNLNCSSKIKVDIIPSKDRCRGWSCSESQLTDMSRVSILKSLNRNREIIASGECSPLCKSPCPYCTKRTYCNVHKLEWHWYLEAKAAEISQTCPRENGKIEVFAEDGPFDDPVFYEMVTGVIQLPRDKGQLAVGNILEWLFWKNFFFDWNFSYKFRRGSASYVGCSIMIRPTLNPEDVPRAYRIRNGTLAHAVCVFASIKQNFHSEEGKPEKNCCKQRNKFLVETKGDGHSFHYLCSVSSRYFTTNCQSNKCSSQKDSIAWNIQFTGKIVSEKSSLAISEVSTVAFSPDTKPVPIINAMYPEADEPNVPKMKELADPYEKKYCMILYMFWFLLVTLVILVLALILRYKYEKENYAKRKKIKSQI